MLTIWSMFFYGIISIEGVYMENLVISIRNYNKNNYREIINNIKDAGFQNVFIEWYNNDLELQQNILNYVKQKDLNIKFAHLGYQNPNSLWEDGNKGDFEVKRYINDIEICKNNGINLVIIHPTFGYYAPIVNEIGIKRIKQIVEFANGIGVKVAFENVELEGYLDYIIQNINLNNLGICFDVGHCHLFFDDKFDTEYFKDKVFAIHLHDNYKTFDQHNLPFDGTVEWEETIKKILGMNYNGDVIIESGYNEYYNGISLKQYYEKAYDVGQKLLEMFNKNSM